MHVPEELMEQLHRAAERFHECRQQLEQWMDSSEYRHQERIDAATEQLRQAERQVEEVEEQIRSVLGSGPPVQSKLPSNNYLG
jgi:DNA repair exonuclease SbcCD ATPase subunit